MNIDRNSHIPIYLQVKEELKKYIAEHHLKSGDPLPTLQKICEMSDISLRTAQKVALSMLEDGSGKRFGRRFVVGDSPSEAERPVRRVYILCHKCAPDYIDDISMKIINAIRGEVEMKNDAEVLFAGKQVEDSLSFFLNNPLIQVAGVIMLLWQDRDKLVKLARAFPGLKFIQTNHVLADLEGLPENVHGVFNDDFAGAFQATEYLIEQGCRRPVFLELAIKDETYRERRNGFMAALQEYGLKGLVYQQESSLGIPLHARIKMYRLFFREVHKMNPALDAVVACYDIMAQAAALELEEEGKTEIPVMGYDAYMDLGHPDFSSVAVNYARIGQVAVRHLDHAERLPRFQKILPKLKLKSKKIEQEMESSHGKYFKIVSF